MPLDNTAKIADMIAKLQELTGINNKADLASFIGGTATATDTMAALMTKLGTSKQSLIDLVNGAQASGDSIKNNTITNLNSKLGTALTAASTWTEIQNAINNYTPGKKFAKGSITTTYSGSWNTATVTGLSFTPKNFIAYDYNGNAVFLVCNTNDSVEKRMYGPISGTLQQQSNTAINGTSVTIMTTSGGTYNWVAYE